MEKFWKKVALIPFHDCWEWVGAKDKSGYGSLWVNGRCRGAHRISWEIHFKEIPYGTHVLHKCDNPGCVRPDHLFIGNNKKNMQDKSLKGRINGFRNPNAVLQNNHILEIKALYKQGMSKRKIGRLFNVHETHIGKIINRQRWKHLLGLP